MKRIILFFILLIASCNISEAREWKGIVIHISDSERMTPNECNEWHKARGWDSCGYNFVIEKDGTAYDARGIERVGAHTKGYNSQYLGICFVSKDKANPEQLDTFHKMISQYELETLPIYPHANFSNKLCGIELAKQLGMFKITAYCSCYKCNGKNTNKTSLGVVPTDITIATNYYELGTKLKIGSKVYTVQDRGSIKKFGTKENPQKHLDVFLRSHKDAKNYGVKWASVNVVK